VKRDVSGPPPMRDAAKRGGTRPSAEPPRNPVGSTCDREQRVGKAAGCAGRRRPRQSDEQERGQAWTVLSREVRHPSCSTRWVCIAWAPSLETPGALWIVTDNPDTPTADFLWRFGARTRASPPTPTMRKRHSHSAPGLFIGAQHDAAL
jgi:hypothetical protein